MNNLLFLETLKCQDGKLCNLDYHNRRFNDCRAHFWDLPSTALEKSIQIPDYAQQGLFKVRIVYGKQIKEINFLPYQIRLIRSLKILIADHLDYSFKYQDRSEINALFEKRGNCDDVLIVKNGLITDTSYANIALYDGREWYTPDQPLLPGTKRARLIDEGILKSIPVRITDLKHFRELCLINAMMELENSKTTKP